MTSNITFLIMLAVFSGLAMNLVLQFGLALKGIAFDASLSREKLLAGAGVLFVTVMFLWLVFSLARSFMFGGLLEYVILFPVSVWVFFCFEYIANRFILKEKQPVPLFANTLSGGTFSGGILAGAALFVTLDVAAGLPQAIALSLGFSGSAALVFVVVAEIRRRSGMESVPRWLRGGPLALIAMGLLSLVFSSGAMVLFGVLGVR